MATLIAEDMLLLLLDDEKGSDVLTSYVATVLGGAVLIELAMIGAVDVEEKSSVWRSAKVRVNPAVVPEDEVLRRAAEVVAQKDRSAQDLVDRLGKGLKEQLADRLVQRGILGQRRDKVLGLFPRTRWPAIDSAHEARVRQALTATLVQGIDPGPRTAAVVALLSSIDRAHKVVDHRGLSRNDVRKRAKAIAEGEWAATAVRDAVSAATAAVAAAVAASSVAATSGS